MKRPGNIAILASLTVVAMTFILSCAKVSSPSGGPRDTDPPVVVKSEPENATTLFRGNSFTITFDEFVVLDKITEKFMVSPPMAVKPDVRLRGKSLVVSWEDKLTDSTTYTFYFQDAVRDNNEGNAIPNFQYVFSTGPVLDSLSITGNVFGAFDLEAVPDILVMMYSNLSDTAPRTILPAYISRPDLSGGFMIGNVRPGEYRLYALKDLNGNSLYDLPDETFAFYDSVINITPEQFYGIFPDTIKFRPEGATETTKPDKFVFGTYRLYAFTTETPKQYLTYSERKSSGSLGFGLAMPSDSGSFSVSLKDVADTSWFMENNALRDTFRIWIKDPEVYEKDILEAMISYPFTDSTGSIVTRYDTVILRYQKPAPPRGGVRRATPLTYSTNLTGKLRPGDIPLFTATTPLLPPDTSLVSLYRRVDTVMVRMPLTFRNDSADSRKLSLKADLQPGNSYQLVCKAGTFRDIYGTMSDSTAYRIVVTTVEDYGSVNVNISGYSGDVIVQLLGDKEKIIRQQVIRAPGKASFGLLDKGKYRIRAVIDVDSSGTWTTGDFKSLRMPEPVTYYPAELDVKINWELEQDWDIGELYKKDVSLRNKPATKK